MRDSSPCLPLNLILILCLFQNGPFPFQSKSYPIESGIIGNNIAATVGKDAN